MHLAVLEMKRKKRAEERKKALELEKRKEFSDYDWLKLFVDGSLSKLKVYKLDKYLENYKIRNTYKLKKKDKVRMIQRHIAMTSDRPQEKDVEAVTQREEESDSKSFSSESDSPDYSGDDIRFLRPRPNEQLANFHNICLFLVIF